LIELNQSNVEAFQKASYLISTAILTDLATIGDTVIINTDSLIGVKVIGQLDLKIVP
jgi:hypothetical protein